MAPRSGPEKFPTSLPPLGREIVVNREKLKSICTELDRNYDNYKNNGSEQNFRSNADVPKDAVGDYPAAQGVAMTCQNAYNYIGQTFGEFMTAYKGVIDAIAQTAGNYQRAEDANADRSRNVYPSGAPTSANSPYAQ